MARSTVSPEIKAAALADLASGEQPAVVAERYKIRPGTVRQWKSRLDLVAPDVTQHVTSTVTPDVTQEIVPIRYPTIEERQVRIHERMLALLEAKINASERLAEHLQSDWLGKQSASGIAELGDYLDRTAIGILAILARRPDADDRGNDPDT